MIRRTIRISSLAFSSESSWKYLSQCSCSSGRSYSSPGNPRVWIDFSHSFLVSSPLSMLFSTRLQCWSINTPQGFCRYFLFFIRRYDLRLLRFFSGRWVLLSVCLTGLYVISSFWYFPSFWCFPLLNPKLSCIICWLTQEFCILSRWSFFTWLH